MTCSSAVIIEPEYKRQDGRQMMNRPGLHQLFILTILMVVCATTPVHRFQHSYSIPQALRFVRQILIDRGYRIAIFDTASGILKTEREDYTAGDGSTVSHQISVTVVTTDELLIKVLPASARSTAAEIMAPLAESLETMGFKTDRESTSLPLP